MAELSQIKYANNIVSGIEQPSYYWIDTENMVGEPDNVCTYCTSYELTDISSIIISDFRFTVPDGAIIKGFKVGLRGYFTGAGELFSAIPGLCVGNSTITNLPLWSFWTSVFTLKEFGDSNDLWQMSGDELLPSTIRENTFGATIFHVHMPEWNGDQIVTTYLDSASITVYYEYEISTSVVLASGLNEVVGLEYLII